MTRVLLTMSGVMDPERPEHVRRGLRPRADYIELAAAMDADLLDCAAARQLAGQTGRLIERLGGRFLLLAWVCFWQRRHYDLIFTDGEQVGIPLAWLLKYTGGGQRPRHLMIAHILSAGKKRLFFDVFRLQSHVDVFFVYSSWQARYIQERWRVPRARVVLTPFMVDSCFFAPERAPAPPASYTSFAGLTVPAGGASTMSAVRPPSASSVASAASPASAAGLRSAGAQICAVGLEYRDYPTLLAAVRDLPVRVVIAAASPWSKRPDTTAGQALPGNVVVRRFDQYELRELYAASSFLVMPLFDVSFQAGVTAILEAMSMGLAVVCSRTAGQTDVVVEGETGLYVPPGDPRALRSAIERLLARPEERERMGQAGRRLVEQYMSLDLYVERLAGYVQACSGSQSNRDREGPTK